VVRHGVNLGRGSGGRQGSLAEGRLGR
jgi:hypothetical protein